MEGKYQCGVTNHELRRQVRETASTARSQIINIVNGVAGMYPTDVFPDDSTTPDACAAKGARLACKLILEALEQLPIADA